MQKLANIPISEIGYLHATAFPQESVTRALAQGDDRANETRRTWPFCAQAASEYRKAQPIKRTEIFKTLKFEMAAQVTRRSSANLCSISCSCGPQLDA
jgi:hypothetical protein